MYTLFSNRLFAMMRQTSAFAQSNTVVGFLVTIFLFVKSDIKTTLIPIVGLRLMVFEVLIQCTSYPTFRQYYLPVRLPSAPLIAFSQWFGGYFCTSYSSTHPTKYRMLKKTQKTSPFAHCQLVESHWHMPQFFAGA
jgi:hypothetical protein